MKHTTTVLQTKRTAADAFTAVFKAFERLLPEESEHTIVVALPSYGKRKRRLNPCFQDSVILVQIGSTTTDSSDSVHEYYRQHVFLPVLDRILTEFRDRFTNNEVVWRGISACHPKSDCFLDEESIRAFADPYGIDTSSLSGEIQILKAAVAPKSESLKTIADILTLMRPLSAGFRSMWKIVQLALTFPVTNAASERSFSTLRRVKTYVRSTMSQDRLSSACLISTEADSDLIHSDDFLDCVIDKFAGIPDADHLLKLPNSRKRRLMLI